MEYLETRRKEKLQERKEKKKGIAQRSKKLRDQMIIYNRERLEFLKANPLCPVTGKLTTEIHHKAGRTGEMLLNKNYWLAVSSEGHRWIELNPAESKRLGLSVSRLTKRS